MKWSVLFLLIVSNISLAVVWEDTNAWDTGWEAKYSKWVKKTLSSDIFSNQESPFYGVKTDCADFILAQRVIFSYEHSLPFQAPNKLSNRSSEYDSVESEIERVKLLIEDLALSFGSYQLADDFSYPIPISEIRSGDIFIYRESSGNFHSYLIKDIRNNGNIELWYSTVPRVVRPILQRVGMPARPITESPYGFLRLRTSDQIGKELSLPSENFEQYQLVREFGEAEAMRKIKKLIRKRKETIKEAVERHISNICTLLESRVRTVSLSLNVTPPQCMDADFQYNYSTTSRDRIIFESIMGLAGLWLKVKSFDQEGEMSDQNIERGLDFLVGREISRKGKYQLKNICSSNIPINMRQYIIRYKKGQLSDNPCVLPQQRWGNTPQ